MNVLRLTDRADFGRPQFVASKVILELQLLWYSLGYLPPQKNKVNAARLLNKLAAARK